MFNRPPRPLSVRFGLLRHMAARALVCGCAVAGGSAPASADTSAADGTPDLQTLLHATREEWGIIAPKLDQIAALREALAATADTPAPPARSVPKIFDSPLGGTSLDAPTMNGRFGRGGANPFDPANAPGMHPRSLLSRARRALGRAVAGGIRPDQANMLQTQLADLDALLKDKDTTDAQLRDKLAEVRAARTHASRDLAAAEKDLMPLLTTDQVAALVALGDLD